MRSEPHLAQSSAAPTSHDARGGDAHGHAAIEEIALPPAPTVKPSTIFTFGAVGVGGLALVFLGGLVPKLHREATVKAETAAAAHAAPKVHALSPKRLPASTELAIPGAVQALQETTIFARTNGYVKKWYVDIGDQVEEGQLLAEIVAPEVDQELRQARATLAQARASLDTTKTNLAYSKVNLGRYKTLAGSGIASQQELDQSQTSFDSGESSVRASEAAIQSQQANVQRLTEMTSFTRVIAPFRGTVTARNVEVGSLVTAGSANTAMALYHIAQVKPVRVFVSVPQLYAPFVKVGAPAAVTTREYGGRVFQGKVTRAAGSLDPGSRTMMTEVQIPNEDKALLPGMYAQVKLPVTAINPPLLVPSTSIVFNGDGTQLAVIGPDGRVKMKKVVLDRDYGLETGISSGLEDSDKIVANPGADIMDGVKVEIAAETPKGA